MGFFEKIGWVFVVLFLAIGLVTMLFFAREDNLRKRNLTSSTGSLATKTEPAKRQSALPEGFRERFEQGRQKLKKKLEQSREELDAQILASLEKQRVHELARVKDCAVYRKKVYESDIDPKLKNLLWEAAVVASEYCWQVDAQPVQKPVKPKQKREPARLQ